MATAGSVGRSGEARSLIPGLSAGPGRLLKVRPSKESVPAGGRAPGRGREKHGIIGMSGPGSNLRFAPCGTRF
jgi:hypothetical protein